MTTVDNDFCLECMECDDQNSNKCTNERANECTNECADLCCLTDSMNTLNITNNINTIMIAKLAEKLTREMNYSKTFIKEKNGYNLNVELPGWFHDLDNKYQNILIKLIEPVLNYYIAQESNID
tara:strand:+ start:1824 stop:2195 length:372 start_codon:yes stop_codon:yes gene_type:complete